MRACCRVCAVGARMDIFVVHGAVPSLLRLFFLNALVVHQRRPARVGVVIVDRKLERGGGGERLSE